MRTIYIPESFKEALAIVIKERRGNVSQTAFIRNRDVSNAAYCRIEQAKSDPLASTLYKLYDTDAPEVLADAIKLWEQYKPQEEEVLREEAQDT